jgi:hypothetical protein
MERHTVEEAAEILGIDLEELRARVRQGDVATERDEAGNIYVLAERDEAGNTYGLRTNASRSDISLGDITRQISVDEIKTLVANLDEAGKQAVAAEATRTASGEAKPEVVTQVVRSSGNVEARKAAVAEAVRSAADDAEARKGIATEALRSLPNDEEREAVAAAAGATPRQSSRRLNVVFSDSAYKTLEKLADDSGKTISDFVRDAIALQKWFNDVRKGGGRILVEERGRVREIINIR